MPAVAEREESMPKRVLVADDEPLTTDMLALMLTFTGYDVTRALDGEEALARAREVQPDVVLLDVMMPGRTGPSVARELRKDPAFDGKIVVLFSCVDENEVAWREAGADAFLQKPISIRELPAVLDELERQKRPIGPGPA
jgi:DNA-binding response OmpR family regulator